MVHLSSRSPMWSSAMTTHVCTAVELLTREIREEGGDGKIERRGRGRGGQGGGGAGGRGEVRGELGVQQWGGEVWRCSGKVRGEAREKGGWEKWGEKSEWRDGGGVRGGRGWRMDSEKGLQSFLYSYKPWKLASLLPCVYCCFFTVASPREGENITSPAPEDFLSETTVELVDSNTATAGRRKKQKRIFFLIW